MSAQQFIELYARLTLDNLNSGSNKFDCKYLDELVYVMLHQYSSELAGTILPIDVPSNDTFFKNIQMNGYTLINSVYNTLEYIGIVKKNLINYIPLGDILREKIILLAGGVSSDDSNSDSETVFSEIDSNEDFVVYKMTKQKTENETDVDESSL